MEILPGGSNISTQEFGFCIQHGEPANLSWDCMKASAYVVPAAIEADVDGDGYR